MPAGPRTRMTTDDSPDAGIREFADAGQGGRVPESLHLGVVSRPGTGIRTGSDHIRGVA